MAKQRFIDKIKEALAKEGLAARTRKSRLWLIDRVKDVKMNAGAKLGFVNLGKTSRAVTGFKSLTLGKMYFYFYDPKTKDKLKYYDTFPLVIPIDYKPASHSASRSEPGILGLNLHYISPTHRMMLLDKLYMIATDSRYDENTKLRMRYSVLINNRSYFKEAMPCLKWYLFSHFRSNALEITADEWEIAMFLPFETFQKQTKDRVWSDSEDKM